METSKDLDSGKSRKAKEKRLIQDTFVVQNLHLKEINIEEMIYFIRGQGVMLDRDLAILYGVETKRLNEQVKRNIERFPNDFMFQLTKEENMDDFLTNHKNYQPNNKCQFPDKEKDNILRSQIATAKERTKSRTLPYAFTRNGIAMLSSVLRSPVAIEVNIRIMRAFTQIYPLIGDTNTFSYRIEALEHHQLEVYQQLSVTNKRLDEVFHKIEKGEVQPVQGIFYDGQIFDAYQFVCNLVRKAKKCIILIDNYVDETVLTLLDKRETGVTATIYTQHLSQQLQLDIVRHNAQYSSIEVKPFNRAHDRFLLIDDEVYHIGASIKDLGKKWFAFTLMHDITSQELLNKIH